MRRVLRSTLEMVCTRTGATTLARRLRADRVAVLAYHNVVDPADAGRGDPSLHLPLPAFLEQIDRLARTHEVVDLRAAPAASGSGRPRAMITFDDAYRGAVTLALPELARRGLAAVVFVSPGLLGVAATWWDEMGEAGLLTPENRATALHVHRGLSTAVRPAFFTDTPPRLPTSYGIATADELRQHCRGGVSVGSHAWAHEHLPSLSADELRRSLDRSLRWVAELGDTACRWLALPYGAGTPEIACRAAGIGYTGVLRIEGGLWRPRGDDLEVPRINVPAGLSAAGLELRASGLLLRA